jgi:extracellular factor (EF) 3-hydroxypalmitic acid methyl ester biosynthesis protein
MHDQRFFDQILHMIETDRLDFAMPMLVGKLYGAFGHREGWSQTRSTYLGHPLRSVMMEDPYIARCVTKPRGYAGDAGLIDLIYDRTPPASATQRGLRIFSHGIEFQASEGVRQRRNLAEQFVGEAARAGKRILSLACGHFREGDPLIGEAFGEIHLVDQDPLSLNVVREKYGDTVQCHEANVFSYLRGAIARGEKFDLVYTLGLTDYLDDRAMALLHKMAKAVLALDGEFILANFVPNHLAIGWMDAVMEWQLIYREPEDLAAFAAGEGLIAKTWRDHTGSIAWSRMELPR